MYDEGKGVKQDYKKAYKLYDKACNHNDAHGCYNAGVMYNHGQGVNVDLGVAKTYYQRACNLKHNDGCLQVMRLAPLDVLMR